ncbi:MAG: hypothetical protein JNL61_20845 [Rhizobiaceae bacterium]|nr:hypothetical protein [Rhizobiaceae bacterium]
MSRYYFDLITAEGMTDDDHGQEMASREVLRKEAIQLLPDIARDELPGGDEECFTVRVRDTDGRYVFEACLILRARWLDLE